MTDPRVPRTVHDWAANCMAVPSEQSAAACWCTTNLPYACNWHFCIIGLGQIPGLDIEVKLIPMIIAVMLAALLAHSNLAVIISGGVGKNGSTVAVSFRLNKYFHLRVSVSLCLDDDAVIPFCLLPTYGKKCNTIPF